MSLILVFISLIAIADVMLFNGNNIYSKVSDTKYFQELKNEISVSINTIAIKNGIPCEAVDSVLTESRIEEDTTVYFDSLSGKNPTAGRDSIDENALANEIYNSIVKYDSNIAESDKNVAKSASLNIAKEYKKILALGHFEKYLAFSEEFKSVSVCILIILLALEVFLSLVVISLNGKRHKHRLYRRFAVVGASSGLTVLIISFIVKFSGVFEKITFYSSEREYNLFTTYFDRFLNCLVIIGIFYVLVNILLLILWYNSVSGKVKR